ncbi:MAG: zf-HC2 domain-containing protein [Ilumatobacteraceae bacterium]
MTEVEALAIQAHLDGCAACRAELTPLAARLASAGVDRLDDVPVTPPELEALVFDRLRAEAGRTAERATKPGPPRGPLEPVAVRALDADVRDLTADVVPQTWAWRSSWPAPASMRAPPTR